MLQNQIYQEQLISNIFERMRSLAGESSGIFYQVRVLDGRPYFGDIAVSREGPAQLHSFGRRLSNGPMLSETATATTEIPKWRKGAWSIQRPAPLLLNQFSLLDQDVEREGLSRSPIWDNLYTPFEIDDQLRALVFDGAKLVGWLGAWRHGREARFSASEQEALNRERSHIFRAVRLIDSLKREQLSADTLFAVCDDAGAIQHASEALRGWLTTPRLDLLSAHLRTLTPAALSHPGVLISGIVLRPLRLLELPGWLVVPGPSSALTLQPSRLLSPRQLEVARLLSVGFTENEAADELDVDVNTIRFYRKSIFKLLNIQAKLELAKFLA